MFSESKEGTGSSALAYVFIVCSVLYLRSMRFGAYFETSSMHICRELAVVVGGICRVRVIIQNHSGYKSFMHYNYAVYLLRHLPTMNTLRRDDLRFLRMDFIQSVSFVSSPERQFRNVASFAIWPVSQVY